MRYSSLASREELSLSPTCQLRQGGTNDAVVQQIMETIMNCELHPDVELIPHIFTDLGIVQHHSSVLDLRMTPRMVYWLYDCPICTQWHWGKVYEEYGTYFGYWDEV